MTLRPSTSKGLSQAQGERSGMCLTEEERFIELLTRNGRMTSLQLAAQLKVSRRQAMQIAQNIKMLGLAPLSTSLKPPGGYWIGTDGFEHLKRRYLILKHEYQTMKKFVVKEAMKRQGKLEV